MKLLRQFRARAWRFSILFHGARIIATVGSIITSSLLSIQYTTVGGADPSNPAAVTEQNHRIFWITLCISFFVTVSNALLTLFKLDKKYYFVHTTLEQLISEGWQYLELTAKYSGFYTPGIQPTHENQFLYFCHAVEKIKMRQVEEEYYKLSELHANISNGSTGASTSTSAGAGQIQQRAAIEGINNAPSSSISPINTNTILPITPLNIITATTTSQPAHTPSNTLLPPEIAKYFPQTLTDLSLGIVENGPSSGRGQENTSPEKRENTKESS